MCEGLGASKSGFYGWLGRDNTDNEKRLLELQIAIEKTHKGSRGTYSPRVFKVLKGQGNGGHSNSNSPCSDLGDVSIYI
jgi:hypothetical protein